MGTNGNGKRKIEEKEKFLGQNYTQGGLGKCETGRRKRGSYSYLRRYEKNPEKKAPVRPEKAKTNPIGFLKKKTRAPGFPPHHPKKKNPPKTQKKGRGGPGGWRREVKNSSKWDEKKKNE